jgi:hypothetical protein
MAVRLSALRTAHTLLPRNIIFLLLVLISVRGSVRPDRLGKLKNFIHLIGSQTRYIAAHSIVLQALHYCLPNVDRLLLLLNVFVQLANKRGFTKKKKKSASDAVKFLDGIQILSCNTAGKKFGHP